MSNKDLIDELSEELKFVNEIVTKARNVILKSRYMQHQKRLRIRISELVAKETNLDFEKGEIEERYDEIFKEENFRDIENGFKSLKEISKKETLS